MTDESKMTDKEILCVAWKISLDTELEKNPKIKRSDMDEIMKWCQQQPHLPLVSENTIALFLLLANYDTELAEIYIENHYTFRTYYKSIFGVRDPLNKDLASTMRTIHCTMLKGLDLEKRRVLFASLRIQDSSKFNVNCAVKYVYMTLEKDILENGFTEDGYSVLFDAKGFGLGHLATITISLLKEIFSYFLDGANVKITQINIINVNSVVEKLINLIKKLAPKEIYERIILYNPDKNHLCLAKFPPNVLPQYLGGIHPLEELCEQNEKEVLELRQWYLADEKYLRVNESKRPKNKQNKKVIKLQANLQALELD